MNEVSQAEYIIETGEFGRKPGTSIFLLARYYRQIMGMRPKETIERIHDIMLQTYPGYVRANWENKIDTIVKNATSRQLVEIKSIPVTEAEIEAIQTMANVKERRLAFTLVVLAKYFNIINTDNNNWVNVEPSRVFSMACIHINSDAQATLYNQLTKHGIITYSHKTGNVNAKVLCLYPDSPTACEVTDLRYIGNDYMMYCGKPYSVCLRCGATFKQNKKHNRKYCRECEGWHPVIRRKFTCADCGKEVFVVSRNTRSTRCPSCQTKERRRMYSVYNARRNKSSANIQQYT